ncbi:zinc ribbon domain-containing protein [Bacillus sp. Bva_UNVM-123]|uniref:zinc ribbon domain-containing protein n=1 Tax=Bacillus sp. Bva_UNVM-123 TaxID=2829798 RepID=UPI00391F4C59
METIYCQSCGMPLTDEKQFGTEKDAGRNTDYCIYCYENGEFKQANISMEDMIEICVPFMKENGMSEKEARTILNQSLPTLKRWSMK